MKDIISITHPSARRSEPLVFKVVHGVPEIPDLPAPTFPDAVSNVLDPLRATTGTDAVIVYTMTPQDQIVLTYNGKAYPAKEGNTNNRVTIRITAADIAASMGKTVQVSYRVTRGDNTGTSPVLSLQVSKPAQGNLPKPDITEVKEGVLDVTQLVDSANLTVQPWPLMAVGQRMFLRFEGVNANGSTAHWNHSQWQNKPITDVFVQRTTVGGAGLKALKDGSTLKLIFEVSFDEGASRIAFPVDALTIKAVPAIPSLPMPTFPDAPGNVLDPMKAINGIDAVVTYAMTAADRIVLTYNGKAYQAQNGNTSNSVTFKITATDIAASMGKTVQVSYRVTRGDNNGSSAVLSLQVGKPAPAQWPAPVIVEAVDGQLNTRRLVKDATLTVQRWSFQQTGQLMYLRLEGTEIDGASWNWPHPDWQGRLVSTVGVQTARIDLFKLKELRGGSTLKAIFEVSFDGGVSKVEFQRATYSIGSVPQVVNDNFESYESGVIGNQDTPFILHASGIVVFIQKGSFNSARIGSLPASPYCTGRIVICDGFSRNGTGGVYVLHLYGDFQSFKLGVFNSVASGEMLRAFFMDAAGRTIGTVNSPSLGERQGAWMTYSSSSRNIRTIRIESYKYIVIDNLELR